MKETGVLQVSYVDEDPVRLVNVLNTAVKILQQKNIEEKSLKAKETLSFLQQQLPLAKKALEAAETVFNDYRAASKKIDIKLETQFLLRQIDDIDKAVNSIKFGAAYTTP